MLRLLDACLNIEHLYIGISSRGQPVLLRNTVALRDESLTSEWISTRQSSLNLVRALSSLKIIRSLDLQIVDSNLPTPITSPPLTCNMPNLIWIHRGG